MTFADPEKVDLTRHAAKIADQVSAGWLAWEGRFHLQGIRGRWMISPYGDGPDWLQAAGLFHQFFATRREALRALRAAAAVIALPEPSVAGAQSRAGWVSADGRWRVRRQARRSWRIEPAAPDNAWLDSCAAVGHILYPTPQRAISSLARVIEAHDPASEPTLIAA